MKGALLLARALTLALTLARPAPLRASPAAAPAPSPITERQEAERYETDVSISALRAAGWRLAASPEGKRVRAVHVLTLPVFLKERGFGLLTTLNALHATTQDAQIL